MGKKINSKLKKASKKLLSLFQKKTPNINLQFRGYFCVSDNDILPRVFKYD